MCPSRLWILSLAVLVLVSAASHDATRVTEKDNNSIKTSVFLSPPFFLRPGSVVNKDFFDIPFPRGHIALKSFDAEVVDDMGIPVPLHETYLHHWVVERYYGTKDTHVDGNSSKIIAARNSGVCNKSLGQYFGLGSETRKTSTWVPGPYGIVIGDQSELPNGYEERWLLNVHAIDTRGAKDRLGCTECRCDLYNATKDEFGRPLRKDYPGGLWCCYDEQQCQVREGFEGGEIRTLYLRYTVRWLKRDDSVVPVKIYIFDVTDSGAVADFSPDKNCKVEYQVDSCRREGLESDRSCVDWKKASIVMPHGGDLIYGVAHQHSGGIGSALYGQDGRLLCSSIPTYGQSEKVGDEDGYIVGMSTCYPKPGSVKIGEGELLTLESNYSSTKMHTGVMGLFYILVAEPKPEQPEFTMLLHNSLIVPWRAVVATYWWAFVLGSGMIVMTMVGVGCI